MEVVLFFSMIKQTTLRRQKYLRQFLRTAQRVIEVERKCKVLSCFSICAFVFFTGDFTLALGCFFFAAFPFGALGFGFDLDLFALFPAMTSPFRI